MTTFRHHESIGKRLLKQFIIWSLIFVLFVIVSQAFLRVEFKIIEIAGRLTIGESQSPRNAIVDSPVFFWDWEYPMNEKYGAAR